ncbi:MAG TPA: TetR/AcrR family transcriptional regulator [Candidatus Limnocylindrales bacterium]|nr:TetR/AcrR family transcriptional regulator [Candidatus Limnocylindrales bacterium]
MARTLDPETHALKRDAFIDVAQRLIQTTGYEELSVQDVLDELSASKGAFYHYFGSKADLLEAVVERMADGVAIVWAGVMAEPGLSATRRLEAVFSSLGQYKTDRRDLVLAVLESWRSDENAIVREKLRRLVAARMTPILAEIVRQGVADAEFTPRHPDEAAGVVVSLIQGANESAVDLYVAAQSGAIGLDAVARVFDAYTEALERILGVVPGTVTLIDRRLLRLWFSPVDQRIERTA